jgi:hypothetical protein
MNKWKTGDVEKAEAKEFSAKDEIEELRRGGTKVTERFREGVHDEEVHKGFDKSELDTAGEFFGIGNCWFEVRDFDFEIRIVGFVVRIVDFEVRVLILRSGLEF